SRFVHAPAPPQIATLSLHDALPISLVGAVPARGRTTAQLEAAIAAALRNGYIRDPDVSVEVDRYRPVFIMGEVGAAGQYAYVPRSEEHTSELQSRENLVCRLLLEKK